MGYLQLANVNSINVNSPRYNAVTFYVYAMKRYFDFPPNKYTNKCFIHDLRFQKRFQLFKFTPMVTNKVKGLEKTAEI